MFERVSELFHPWEVSHYVGMVQIGMRRDKDRARPGLGLGLGPQAWLYDLFSKSPNPHLNNEHLGQQKKAGAQPDPAVFRPDAALGLDPYDRCRLNTLVYLCTYMNLGEE
jgi:hypothetical protein